MLLVKPRPLRGAHPDPHLVPRDPVAGGAGGTRSLGRRSCHAPSWGWRGVGGAGSGPPRATWEGPSGVCPRDEAWPLWAELGTWSHGPGRGLGRPQRVDVEDEAGGGGGETQERTLGGLRKVNDWPEQVGRPRPQPQSSPLPSPLPLSAGTSENLPPSGQQFQWQE